MLGGAASSNFTNKTGWSRVDSTTTWNVALLSIHPEFVSKIFNGSKTIELRRIKIRCAHLLPTPRKRNRSRPLALNGS